jgi:integrase
MGNEGLIGKNFPTCQTSGKAFFEVHKKRKYTSGQRALTQDQVQSLLLQITDLIHLGLFQLSVVSGCRREDVVQIKKSDLDFEKQAVIYYESKKNRTRTVYIPITVMNTLQMICNANKKEPYLFPGGSGKKINGRRHMSGRNAWNLFQAYLKKAGLEPRPFHALRATCIKLAQRRGWSIEQTAELVGDTISTIQEHYITPSEEEMKEAVNQKPIL